MILGIGTDIVNVDRIARLIERFGDRFLNRIFTDHELLKAYSNQAHYVSILAKRFAAKEAVSKALGTGFRNGLRFKDIEVVSNALGRPEICLHGQAKICATALANGEVFKAHLSLSDDYPFAQAFVVIEG